MKYELKRIHIWSVAKMTFLITLILGLLMSLFYIVSLSLVQNLIGYIGEGIIDESMLQLVSAHSLFLKAEMGFRHCPRGHIPHFQHLPTEGGAGLDILSGKDCRN